MSSHDIWIEVRPVEPYRNLTGKSRVLAYKTGEDFIEVQFKDRSVYVYKYSSNGQQNIDTMKTLAESGTGLDRFIQRNAVAAKAM